MNNGTKIERDKTLMRAHSMERPQNKRDNKMIRDTRTALDANDYNELLEMYELKHGEKAQVLIEAKYRIKGVKGGIAQLFSKQNPEHVFARAIASHGSTNEEFTCTETGQRYVIRINGAKVAD